MNNPFQGVGQIARGERFVARPELTAAVLSSWEGERAGNLSLRGTYRVGKSSLIRDALEKYSRRNPDKAVVMIRAGSIRSGVGLLRALVKGARISLDSRMDGPGEVQAALRMAAAVESEHWSDASEAVSDLFLLISEFGIGTLIVIDEFDRLSAWCSTPEFQFLRDLASEPEYNVGLSVVSRRSVYEIEVAGSDGSHLGGVLGHSISVPLMSDSEAAGLIGRGARAGLDFESSRERILSLAGTHPFLLELLCFSLCEQVLQGARVDVERAYLRVKAQFEAVFRTYLVLLHEEFPDLYWEMDESIRGRGDFGLMSDPDRLVALGVSRWSDEVGLVPLSESFAQYWLSRG